MLKPKTAFLKFSECIKVVKFAVKIVQNSAGMYIIMVSSVCGIAYKNISLVNHTTFLGVALIDYKHPSERV